MKEKLCYVAADYETEMARPLAELETSYTVNGKLITLGTERFRCPEALFNPSLVGKDIPTIQETVAKSIMKCPVDHRKEIFSNIVLAGGSTCYPGKSR
jgi:actin